MHANINSTNISNNNIGVNIIININATNIGVNIFSNNSAIIIINITATDISNNIVATITGVNNSTTTSTTYRWYLHLG